MSYDQLYVGGRWVRPTGDLVAVRSTHDGQVFAHAATASVADIDRAVSAARVAFDDGPWPHLSVEDRIAPIERLAELHRKHADELATLIAQQTGAPITFAQFGQVGGVAVLLQGFVDAARRLAWDELFEGPFGPTRILHEPVGVVAAIPAFNVPQLILLGKMIPTLLAGCTVVAKPSPEVPLDALLLAELLDEVGLPEGVVSIVPGGPEAGQHLVAHPDVDHVTFTGSTPVGREIGKVCGEQLKRVSLELGGKSAAIVLDDADIARTAAGLRFASFLNNGQACAAQTRVLAPRARYAEVVDGLADAVSSFVVGDPLDVATEIGPLVSRRQQEKVQRFVAMGRTEGARVVVGDGALAPDLAAGNYVAPTLFADVDNRMRIAQEEIFGPVLVVIPYEDDDDAVRVANDSDFGLGGSVWTGDKARGFEIARRVRTGTFGVNRYGPDPTTPFGGFKASGIGREYGIEGLRAFTELKAVHGL